jgi:hypothetical protein
MIRMEEVDGRSCTKLEEHINKSFDDEQVVFLRLYYAEYLPQHVYHGWSGLINDE